MDYTKMTIEDLDARLAAIATESEAPEADLDALTEEVRAIKAEKEARKQAENKRKEIRNTVAAGAGIVIDKAPAPIKEARKMFEINSTEYRDAWTRHVCNIPMSEEERAALTNAGAVIPTLTVNAVWDRLIKPAELLSRVDVSQFPSYVRFPKATTVNAATAQAVSTTISESADVIGYVDLVPNEYVKLITVKADIEHMAISAVHDWLVNNITESIRYAINKDVLVGSGSNALKGIVQSVNANGTALPATVTKASLLKIMAALGSAYQSGAIWIMTPAMFYEKVMSVTQLNDYVINNGFERKLFGHDVVLMSEAAISSKETIFFGDPKAYKVNIFKAIEVKPFETATTTAIQFRGACMADGELLDTSAFVRFAQT